MGVDCEKFSRKQFIERDIRMELNIPPSATVIGILSVFRTQKRLLLWLDIVVELHKKVSLFVFYHCWRWRNERKIHPEKQKN